MNKSATSKTADKATDRSERLKQALRANLKRRKTQAKAKQASKDEGPSSAR